MLRKMYLSILLLQKMWTFISRCFNTVFFAFLAYILLVRIISPIFRVQLPGLASLVQPAGLPRLPLPKPLHRQTRRKVNICYVLIW